jgi:hypothetical protein
MSSQRQDGLETRYTKAWDAVAAALELTPYDADHPWILEGRVSGHAVRVSREAGGRDVRVDVDGLPPLTVAAGSGGGVATGDPQFDSRFRVDGDPVIALSALDASARQGLVDAVPLRPTLSDRVLSASAPCRPDARLIESRVHRVLGLARAMCAGRTVLNPRLLDRLRTEQHPAVRLGLLDALIRLRPKSSDKLVAARLAASDPDPAVAAYAARYLETAGDADDIRTPVPASRVGPDRAAAAGGPAVVKRLVAALDADGMRRHLHSAGDRRAELLTALRDVAADQGIAEPIRADALHTLLGAQAPEAGEAARACVRSRHPELFGATLRAIAAYAPDLLPGLATALGRSEARRFVLGATYRGRPMGLAVAHALALADASGEPALIALLDAPDADVRRAAVRALGAVGTAHGAGALKRFAVAHPDQARTVDEALRAISRRQSG